MVSDLVFGSAFLSEVKVGWKLLDHDRSEISPGFSFVGNAVSLQIEPLSLVSQSDGMLRLALDLVDNLVTVNNIMCPPISSLIPAEEQQNVMGCTNIKSIR